MHLYIFSAQPPSPSLVLSCLLYRFGSGLGGSLRASPGSSSLQGSLGVRLRGSLMGSIQGRMGGSIGSRLRGSLGSSLRVSLRGSPGSRLKGRLGGSLLVSERGRLQDSLGRPLLDLFNDEELFGTFSQS